MKFHQREVFWRGKLFLSPRYTFPPDTGAKVSIYHLIEQLSQIHKITIVSFVESDDSLGTGEVLGSWRSVVDFIHDRQDVMPSWSLS